MNEEKTRQQTAFFDAAAQGDLATVKRWLEAGMDVNAANPQDWNCTALMKAADNGHLEVVRFLLEHGAVIQQTDAMDWPALAHAADAGQVGIVKLLLASGADVHFVSSLVDRGVPWGTALNIARHRPEVVGVLREAGAKE